MTSNLRLLRIETRRNVALWLLPLMLALPWYLGREAYPDGVVLWIEASVETGAALIVLGPIVGGTAAWMAGRDRRRCIGDLLSTTARPPLARDLALWLATALWGVLAYVMVGGYRFVEAAREATWGEPDWSPISVGLVALLACAAVGYAAGVLVPSRFTAPLVAVALFAVQAYPTTVMETIEDEQGVASFDSPVQYLSPWTFVDHVYTVQLGIQPDVGASLMAWTGGLGAAALAVVALWRRRTAPGWGALLAAVVLAVVGATSLLQTGDELSERSRMGLQASRFDEITPEVLHVIPYELACVDAAIPVCLHPAYEAVLDETAAIVGPLVEPIIGLPGVPTRAEEPNSFASVPPADDTLVIQPYHASIGGKHLTEDIAFRLVWEPPAAPAMSPPPAGAIAAVLVPEGLNEAQSAVALWLFQQAGHEPNLSAPCATNLLPLDTFPRCDQPWSAGMEATIARIRAAVDRFSALAPPAQRAWLEANWAALRAAELTLEALP